RRPDHGATNERTLPAGRPPQTIVLAEPASSPRILAHFAAKAAQSVGSLAVKAAIHLAAGSCWCSKKVARSPSATARNATSLVGQLTTSFPECLPPTNTQAPRPTPPSKPRFGARNAAAGWV